VTSAELFIGGVIGSQLAAAIVGDTVTTTASGRTGSCECGSQGRLSVESLT